MRRYGFAFLMLAVGTIGCGGRVDEKEALALYRPWFVQGDDELDEPGDSVVPSPGVAPAVAPAAAAPAPEDDPERPVVKVDDEVHLEDEPAGEAREVTIQVRLGETLRLYSNWSGVAIDDLKAQNQLGKRGGLRFGRAFVLSLTPKAYRAFKMAREEYFTKLENEFFAHFEVVKLHRYKVERGDNLWKVAKRHGDLPIWVLEKFNNASDLARLSVGKDLLLPELKEITSGKLRAAATIWKDAPGGAPGDAPDAGRPGEAPKRTAAERAAKKAPKAEVAARRGLVVSVAKGESLRLYARWSGVGSKSIIRANPGIDPSRLRIGQKVHVPMPDQRISAFYRLRRKHNGLRTPAALTERPARRAPTRDAKRFIRHRVKKGESAWKIAVKRYNISVGDLRRANPGKDLSALQVGDVLKVPLPAARPGGPRRVRAP